MMMIGVGTTSITMLKTNRRLQSKFSL